MTGTTQSRYTQEQIAAWLRGLLAIAWADGQFDKEERDLIASLMEDATSLQIELEGTRTITPTELAASLGNDPNTTENFLRTAVMVAIADGTYSPSEDALLQHFCDALGLQSTILESLRVTLTTPSTQVAVASTYPITSDLSHPFAPLSPVQEWLDHLEIHDPRLAKFLCKMIPPQCPFERDVVLFGHKIVHIPALCKLNPLYEQMVGLRFRALSYLADDCGEDISPYC